MDLLMSTIPPIDNTTATIPTYAPPWGQVANITPFTYRDGLTYVQILEGMRAYINKVLVPFVNTQVEYLSDAFVEEVNRLIDAVNAAIDMVIDGSIELQDPVMAQIVADLDSETRTLLDTLYADKSVQETVETGRLSQAELDAAYAAKSVQDTVETGRLSQAALDAAYAHQSIEDIVETGRLSQANLDATYAVKGLLEAIPAYQINPTTLRKWRLALGRSRASGTIAKVLFIGDSTTQGSESVAMSFPTAFIAAMNRLGTRTRSGIIAPATNIPDDRWGVTAGWTVSGVIGPAGGTFTSGIGNSNQLYTAPKVPFTNILFHYLRGTGGVSTVVDGSTTLATIDTRAGTPNTWGSQEVVVAGTAASIYGINGPTLGPINILGFEARDTNNPSIVAVSNFGQSGVTALDWANDTYSLDSISYVAPDLSIIMLGINDAQGNATVGDFITRITSIVNRAKQTGDVVLLTFPESDPTFLPGLGTLEQSYLAALKDYAKVNNIALIDVNARMGGYSDYNNNAWYRDRIHQSNAANKDIAEAIATVVLP
jgi:lysophospholipase L1-like esterase/uncharacterized protein YggL (DUF469 family)